MQSLALIKPSSISALKACKSHNAPRSTRLVCCNAFNNNTNNISKAIITASLISALTINPAVAAIDTDTFKAGAKATIEASPLHDQSARDVIRTLKDVVLPEVEAKLSDHANGAGSSYPDSVVKELQTVRSELDALDRQLAQGSNDSNLKSMASAVEQQMNALKAILGFD